MWDFEDFKDSTITTTIKTRIKDKGQVITSYDLDKTYDVDMQPIEESIKAKTWGNDIEATYQFYSDIELAVEDVIVFKNKPYKIEKIIPWISYNIYAIKEADVIIDG